MGNRASVIPNDQPGCIERRGKPTVPAPFKGKSQRPLNDSQTGGSFASLRRRTILRACSTLVSLLSYA